MLLIKENKFGSQAQVWRVTRESGTAKKNLLMVEDGPFSVRSRIDTESWSVSVVIQFFFTVRAHIFYFCYVHLCLIYALSVLLLWQKVKELLFCLKWRISTGCEMMMRLLLPLMIPSSRLQRLVPFLCSPKTDRKQDTLWQLLIFQGTLVFVSSTHTNTHLADAFTSAGFLYKTDVDCKLRCVCVLSAAVWCHVSRRGLPAT